MIVDSIEMENFKSYGKKQLIKLRKGFTVIIGPNGSGKSNIGDSMLFVLGIRSNKTVRVDKLSDFIHKSDTPKKRCYVTLNIISDDNTKFSLKREIIYSNGEYKSNYYINDKRSKYNEVSKLIDSFHIYLDAYSFVLQGDINNILKMSGAERRKLFESMAGIESYKEKIENSKNDINGLNENISRIEAVLNEINTVLKSLDIDRENARKYNEIKTEIDDMKLFLKVKDKHRIENEIDIYDKNIENLKNKIDEMKKNNEKLIENKNNINNNINEIEKKLNELGGSEILSIRKNIEKINITVAELTTKLKSDKELIANTEMRLRTSKDALNFLEDEINKKNREKKNYETYLKTANNNVNRIGEDLKKFRLENYENSKKIKELNTRLSEIDNESQVLNDKINSNSDINKLNEELSSFNKELSLNEENSKNETMKIKDYKWKIETYKDNINEYNKDINAINKRFIDLRNSLNDIVTEKNNNDIKIREKEKELRNLNYHGNSSPALREINYMIENSIINGIYGQLKNLMEYDDLYANAIIVSGGSRLNSIVVDNDLIAQKCIEILKNKKLGRLTFIPLNKIMIPKDHDKSIELVKSAEATGFIRDFVRYDKKFEKAILYTFGDTVLMENIEKARKYMTGIRIVTFDGDILDPSGSMTGGYIKNDEILYNKINKLIADLEEENSLIIPQINQKNNEVSEISKQLIELTKKRDIENNNLKNVNELLIAAESEVKNIDEKIKILENKIDENTKRRENIEFNNKKLQLDLYNLKKERDEIFKELKKINPENMEIEREMENELNDARKNAESYSNNISVIDNDLKHFIERKNDLINKIENYNNELNDKNNEINNYNENINNLSMELDDYKTKEYEIDSKSRDLYNKKLELKDEYDDLSNKIRINEDDINSKNMIMATMKAKIENLASQLDEIEEEIVNNKSELKEFKMSVNEIKNKIDLDYKKIDELGPINQKAIDEYDIEYEKYKDNKNKYDTLINEKNSLIELQNKIIEDEKNAFMDLFDSINSQFHIIYSKLSGGGEANLEITDRDDPLNSEIYIKARPKGEYMIKIDALSGGEKSLAVLALILSFQIKNPSPLYYLDEVDMFLDGNNAEHVGELFSENSNKSQIVMVSLKGAVSKFANNIIGVTVDGNGNTQIIEKSLENKDEKNDINKTKRDGNNESE